MSDDLDAFTIRIPRELKAQIDARAAINHRKRNGEITALLEKAIDDAVAADRALLSGSGSSRT